MTPRQGKKQRGAFRHLDRQYHKKPETFKAPLINSEEFEKITNLEKEEIEEEKDSA